MPGVHAEDSDWDEDDDLSELEEIGDSTKAVPFTSSGGSTGTIKARGGVESIAASIESQLLVCSYVNT